MNFAYWRKCDFQVHSPRDPNWVGPRPPGLGEPSPVTGQPVDERELEDGRLEWASAFVDACATRGLSAVALTDHHEMVMVPYVQRAVAERKQNDATFDLWVFPGMELTCHGGKQCLILFDVDLSAEWWRQAQGKLGIVHAKVDSNASKGSSVQQLACNYADVGSELEGITELQGRYIVLPNVSQGGGQYTVLTKGNHADFRRMKYVGAYLDRSQTLKTLGATSKKRLSGTDPSWAKRHVYPLPTSDSRSSDFAHLGTNDTWIKLANPTAEAIRQAFLGYRSRISITPPGTPSLLVASLDVKGATILADEEIAASPELNSIIGGRGSGKSTWLEYLAFGLGRSCYDTSRKDYSGAKRLESLIKDTLISKNGSVDLRVVQDGARFRISRGPANAYQPQVTYPNGDQLTLSPKDVRDLFPATVLGQGELSEIGAQTGVRTQLVGLLPFVNSEYKQEDDRSLAAIDAARSSVSVAVHRVASLWTLEAKLRRSITTRDSLQQRVAALEKNLPELAVDEQVKITRFNAVEAFEAKRKQASKHADLIVEGLAEALRTLSGKRDVSSNLKDAAAIQQGYDLLYQSFFDSLGQLKSEVEHRRVALKAAERAWSTVHESARAARDEALAKLNEHKTLAAQVIKLREEAAAAVNDVSDIETQLKSLGDPTTLMRESIKRLRNLVDRRAKRTRVWATEIENLSSRRIKAEVVSDGDLTAVKEAIDLLASKTGSQEATRTKAFDDAIGTVGLWDWLDRLLSDSLALLRWSQVGRHAGEDRPKCSDLLGLMGETDRIKTALSERLDVSRVAAIAAAVSKPEIKLFYCDGEREIAFEKASEGQRAGAFLLMLLEQPGGPLIIDQPEGDLDNRVIVDLAEKLHDSKVRRQIFFASHNANFVVNGSSELVGHLEVGSNGKRSFRCVGAIDDPTICRLIAETMEGGEKAFTDRRDKYGY